MAVIIFSSDLLDESEQGGDLSRWFLHLLMAALSCTLGACESAWPDLRQNPGTSLVLGTTTKDEVIARYGKPVERGAPISEGLRMDAIGYYGRHFFDEPVVVPNSAPVSYLTLEFYQGKLVSWSFASVYASDPTNFDIEKAKLIKPGDKSSSVRELIGEPSGRGIYPDSPKGTEMWHYWFAWTDGRGLHDWMLRVQITSDGAVASSDLVENE